MTQAAQEPVKLTKKDLDPGVDVRWCPGCGDYAILASVQKTFATFGVPREKLVFISGIGCSSRFPYYMNTYGFHTIHGRAPAFATGLKSFRDDLEVWVVTGDGDGLSIGGNHLIHAMRRNVNIKILLFNNRIYGLTKGQYSPTSEFGKVTKSTPMGSIDTPFRPLSVALGTECSFVARIGDTDAKGMQQVFEAAHAHKGTAFVEIYQNCPVFNDNAFIQIMDKKERDHAQLILEHGKPMLFDKGTKGIVLKGGRPAVATLGENGVTEADILVHDAHDPDPTLAFMLSRLEPPEFPVPMGVVRAVDRPIYDELMKSQLTQARKKQGEGDLHKMLYSGDIWTVEAH